MFQACTPSLCCLVVVLATSMEALEAFSTMEAFMEHHLEATKGGEQARLFFVGAVCSRIGSMVCQS